MEVSAVHIKHVLRSAIVPPLCVCCREPELSGRALCRECDRKLKPALAGTASAWSAFEYEGVARELVHSLKSRGNLAAATAMAIGIVRREPPVAPDTVLVPVPAHAARRRRHGFNHAHQLARALARELDLELADALKRRHSQRQTGLRRSERIAAAGNSVIARPVAAELEKLTLVDDVYTTGSTLDACAQALRQAGAGHINVVTFARAGNY